MSRIRPQSLKLSDYRCERKRRKRVLYFRDKCVGICICHPRLTCMGNEARLAITCQRTSVEACQPHKVENHESCLIFNFVSPVLPPAIALAEDGSKFTQHRGRASGAAACLTFLRRDVGVRYTCRSSFPKRVLVSPGLTVLLVLGTSI